MELSLGRRIVLREACGDFEVRCLKIEREMYWSLTYQGARSIHVVRSKFLVR